MRRLLRIAIARSAPANSGNEPRALTIPAVLKGHCWRPWLVLIVSVVAAVALTPVQAAVRPPKLQYQIATLPNGLRVILSEDHSTPIVHVAVWYHVGSKNERPGRTGFAHLF